MWNQNLTDYSSNEKWQYSPIENISYGDTVQSLYKAK